MNEVCFWSGWEPATMHFCEELRCAAIVQPANAFSSLAFVAVGLALWRRGDRRPALTLFPVSAVLVGISSFLYHASWTFFFQVFDVSSMFMLSCLLLVFNARRLGLLTPARLPLAYVLLLTASIAALLTLRGRSGEWLFGGEVAVFLLSEAVLFRRETGTDYAFFVRGLATFAAAFAAWILDVREIVCDPRNHFLQGHALWHVLNSLCYWFLYRFYLQFELR